MYHCENIEISFSADRHMFGNRRAGNRCTGMSLESDKFFLLRKTELAGNKILVDIKFAAKDRGCNKFPLFSG